MDYTLTIKQECYVSSVPLGTEGVLDTVTVTWQKVPCDSDILGQKKNGGIGNIQNELWLSIELN